MPRATRVSVKATEVESPAPSTTPNSVPEHLAGTVLKVVRETPVWDSGDYLKFERERTLPCRDLVARIELGSPKTIVDLGCGPGNSTSVLAERWPHARITGVDNSEEMLRTARASPLRAEWLLRDISDWTPSSPLDLVFSNAALQWVPHHESEIPRLFRHVSQDGAFAFQIPSGEGSWTKAIRAVSDSSEWRGVLSEDLVDLRTQDLPYYYGLLAPLARRVELWETSYVHVFPGPASVVEWTRGSALRPILQRLPQERRPAFIRDYLLAIEEAYPRLRDGKVLFPFLRRFVVAYRK